MSIEKVQLIKGFKDLLILGEDGKVEYQHSSSENAIKADILAGFLASAFTVAENATFSFVGNLMELAFDGISGSVLLIQNKEHYFFLILDGTPSMGIARLKLRELADEYVL